MFTRLLRQPPLQCTTKMYHHNVPPNVPPQCTTATTTAMYYYYQFTTHKLHKNRQHRTYNAHRTELDWNFLMVDLVKCSNEVDLLNPGFWHTIQCTLYGVRNSQNGITSTETFPLGELCSGKHMHLYFPYTYCRTDTNHPNTCECTGVMLVDIWQLQRKVDPLKLR